MVLWLITDIQLFTFSFFFLPFFPLFIRKKMLISKEDKNRIEHNQDSEFRYNLKVLR